MDFSHFRHGCKCLPKTAKICPAAMQQRKSGASGPLARDTLVSLGRPPLTLPICRQALVEFKGEISVSRKVRHHASVHWLERHNIINARC